MSLQRGLPEFVKRTPVFKKVEVNKLQTVFPLAISSASQTVNPRNGTIDNPGEFSSELRRAVFDQAQARSLRGKPGWLPIRFLGLF